MKQAIAAFLLCLSLVLGGVALAAHTLQEDAGQVAVTAISRQGDPAAAQGLVATQSCQYAQTLLWDLTIPLDRPAQSTTAFSAQGDVPAAANDDAGVYLRFPHQDATLSAEPGYSLDNLPTSPALGPLYEQVARRTPPGQTRTEILDPSQFLDAYPLQVTLDLAGQSPDYSQAETFESQFDPSAQEAFQAFFRFPFAPDTRWKVTVTKDQDGLLTQLAIAPTGEEFLTGTVSTVGAHTAYYTDGKHPPGLSAGPRGLRALPAARPDGGRGTRPNRPGQPGDGLSPGPSGGVGSLPHPLSPGGHPLPGHHPGRPNALLGPGHGDHGPANRVFHSRRQTHPAP